MPNKQERLLDDVHEIVTVFDVVLTVYNSSDGQRKQRSKQQPSSDATHDCACPVSSAQLSTSLLLDSAYTNLCVRHASLRLQALTAVCKWVAPVEEGEQESPVSVTHACHEPLVQHCNHSCHSSPSKLCKVLTMKPPHPRTTLSCNPRSAPSTNAKLCTYICQ